MPWAREFVATGYARLEETVMKPCGGATKSFGDSIRKSIGDGTKGF
jgi:hypothetical protein